MSLEYHSATVGLGRYWKFRRRDIGRIAKSVCIPVYAGIFLSVGLFALLLFSVLEYARKESGSFPFTLAGLLLSLLIALFLTVLAGHRWHKELCTQVRNSDEHGMGSIFRRLNDSNIIGIIFWNTAGEVTEANDEFLQMTGYTREDVAAGHVRWKDMTPPEYAVTDAQALKELAETGVTKNYEKEFFRKDGSRMPILIGAALLDGCDDVGICYVQDLSGTKKAAEELKESERRFRSLMEQSPLAIEILTPDGKISQVNAAWMRLWGFGEAETVAVLEKYNMLTDKQCAELGVAPLVRKAFEGDPVVLPPIEYVGSRTMEDIGLGEIRGTSPWIQCHLYPVKDANEKIAYVVNTYMNMTELKHAEEDVREQRETLARVNRTRSMGQLTGAIAHELNQPLTGILSNAQACELMLKNEGSGISDIAESIADIVADAKRAGEVIRNLRDLYREQKGVFNAVDMNKVVAETLRILRSETLMHHVTVTTHCEEGFPCVSGNKAQLQQVLVNLIMNGDEAMDNMPETERRLSVTVAHGSGVITVFVEDSGPGIPSDKIDRIFEPLATWKPDGTGMGLAISNTIIDAHGGKIWAENKPGGGAKIGFSIPVLEKML